MPKTPTMQPNMELLGDKSTLFLTSLYGLIGPVASVHKDVANLIAKRVGYRSLPNGYFENAAANRRPALTRVGPGQEMVRFTSAGIEYLQNLVREARAVI